MNINNMYQEQQKYDSLLHELEQLRTENTRLKEILQANGIAYEVVTTNADEEKVYSDITFPDVHLGKDERVELFRWENGTVLLSASSFFLPSSFLLASLSVLRSFIVR